MSDRQFDDGDRVRGQRPSDLTKVYTGVIDGTKGKRPDASTGEWIYKVLFDGENENYAYISEGKLFDLLPEQGALFDL